VVVAVRCTSCGECVEICPTDAITLRNEPVG
jgi:ferredoxin